MFPTHPLHFECGKEVFLPTMTYTHPMDSNDIYKALSMHIIRHTPTHLSQTASNHKVFHRAEHSCKTSSVPSLCRMGQVEERGSRSPIQNITCTAGVESVVSVGFDFAS
jgi:hypothetical protein